MDLWTIVIWIVIGAVVGWLAGLVMKSQKSLLWNIILGIAGVLVGGWIAGHFGIGGGGLVITIIIGVAGACLLIFLGRVLKLTK